MMTRSSHIAIKIPPEDVERAVQHYKAALGVEEKSRTETCVELGGPNFTLWIDATDTEPIVLQEFADTDREAAMNRHRALGCELFDESPQGFHVRDPFGMHYHVWTSDSVP